MTTKSILFASFVATTASMMAACGNEAQQVTEQAEKTTPAKQTSTTTETTAKVKTPELGVEDLYYADADAIIPPSQQY